VAAYAAFPTEGVKEMFENRNEDLITALINEARDAIKSDSLKRS
jgi:hypothetical protein